MNLRSQLSNVRYFFFSFISLGTESYSTCDTLDTRCLSTRRSHSPHFIVGLKVCWCARRTSTAPNKNRQAHAKRGRRRCGRGSTHSPHSPNAHTRSGHTLKVVCHATQPHHQHIASRPMVLNTIFLCYAFMFTSQSQSISSASSYGWFCVHSLILQSNGVCEIRRRRLDCRYN